MRWPVNRLDIHALYNRFELPIMDVDCGQMCAPHNPNSKPFCCDICHAVPVAYQEEWEFLQSRTELWHVWRGDECACEPVDPADLRSETPGHLALLACKGPAYCERPNRTIACRQFPFFPYIDSNDLFLGLTYYWDFEPTCWVISNLGLVSAAYRKVFVRVFDEILARRDEELDSYAGSSEEMRETFQAKRRRIPLLHRNGGTYLISPASEAMRRVDPAVLRKFGPYRAAA